VCENYADLLCSDWISRRAMNCFADALVGSATADVSTHEIVISASWGWLFFESKAAADMICPHWQ